ncbi:hypothetical protein V8B97DRAFT_2026320 [Scleroderma yunnanense]
MVSQQKPPTPRTDLGTTPPSKVAKPTLGLLLPTEGTIDIPPVAGLFDNATSTKEATKYTPSIVAIEKHLEEFKVEGASVLSSTVQLCETDLKPDVAIYDKDSGCKDKKRIDFSALDISLFDPFDDDEGTPFERDTINGKSTRGQMTAYATARLGKAFNYVQNPENLDKFFPRFASLSRKGHGWDTSPGLGTTPTQGKDYYIGGRPRCPYSLIGRSTRAWQVYCVSTKQVIFLKDTWRIDSDNIDPESVT